MDNATSTGDLFSSNNSILTAAATAVTNGQITQADADQITAFVSISDSSYSYWTINNGYNYTKWANILNSGKSYAVNGAEVGKADVLAGVSGALDGAVGGIAGAVAFGILGAGCGSLYTIFMSLSF